MNLRNSLVLHHTAARLRQKIYLASLRKEALKEIKRGTKSWRRYIATGGGAW